MEQTNLGNKLEHHPVHTIMSSSYFFFLRRFYPTILSHEKKTTIYDALITMNHYVSSLSVNFNTNPNLSWWNHHCSSFSWCFWCLNHLKRFSCQILIHASTQDSWGSTHWALRQALDLAATREAKKNAQHVQRKWT